MNPIAAFLDPAHQTLADGVSRWCRGALAEAPAPSGDEAARSEARALLAGIGKAGWLAPIAKQDVRGVCLVRETMAACSPLADAVVAIQGLGATPLLLGGSDEQRREWLDGLIQGRTMAAFAMSEPDAGTDVAAMRTTARRDGDDWVLDGEKHLISNAGLADLYLVFAKTSPDQGSRGISLFLVPSSARGLRFTGAQMLAEPHPLGRVTFERCRVPASALVGPVDQGFKLGMMTLDRLRPTVGAAACGMAMRALREAVTHARTRRQFGNPLAALQLVRARIGRMAAELDAARLLVYRAAWEFDQGKMRNSTSAAMAKSVATETAQRVVDDAVQIVGGVGVLVGHPVERLYRAIRALRIYEGTTDIQYLIIAASLLDGDARA